MSSRPSQGRPQTLGEALDPLPAEAVGPAAPTASGAARPTILTPPAPAKSHFGLTLTGLLLVAAAMFFFVPKAIREDPHFTQAKSMLELYERPRAESERNYKNPIYAEVLAHLDQVGRESRSWSEAQALAAEVRGRIEAFLQRTESAGRHAEERIEQRERRDQEFFDAQRRATLTPVTTFPECEHEGGGKHRHIHKTTN